MGNALSRLRRSVPLVVSVIALAIATAGCSLVEMPSNRSLAGPPQAAGTSTHSASHTAAAPPPELDVTQAERQSANARTISASFSERISGAAQVTLSGQVQAQRTPLRIAEQLTLTSGGQPLQLEAIVTSRAIYAQMSSEPGYWIKLPLPRVDRSALLQELRNADPTQETSLLLAAGHARFTGRQTVDGVVTSRYVASVAPQAALGAAPSALRARLAPLVSLVTGKIHYVLWIEPGEHLKQFRVTERALGSRITVTETINSVDQPLHITIPQATRVPSSLSGLLASV
jgi:hypothetical protein